MGAQEVEGQGVGAQGANFFRGNARHGPTISSGCRRKFQSTLEPHVTGDGFVGSLALWLTGASSFFSLLSSLGLSDLKVYEP